MPKRRYLTLTDEQRETLVAMRDHHAKAYMRERAAALIKIADGKSGHYVAQEGLLKARDPDTIYTWLRRYERQGIGGLYNRPGRGRKPAFSP